MLELNDSLDNKIATHVENINNSNEYVHENISKLNYSNKTIKKSTNTIYVSTKGNDSNDGSTKAPKKSLTNAVNSISNGGKIYLKNGTYFEHGIYINKNITIIGDNSKNTFVNGQHNHIFTIAPSTTVTFETFSIKNAYADNGGAIYNKGTLKLTGMRLYSSTARNGGAIYNKGNLNLYKTLFTLNTAKYGASIYNLNSIEANKCVFTKNNATNFASAIYSNNYIKLVSCNFTYNNNSPILIENSKKLNNITSSLFEYNTAINGGSIFNKKSRLTIQTTYFKNNNASKFGGVLYNSGITSIKSSSLLNNKAQNGGAVYNKNLTTATNSSFKNNIASNEGGAVYNSYNMSLSEDKFENNSANNGGAISSTSNSKVTLNIDKTLLILNYAKIFGGAVYITNLNQLNLKNSNITYNSNKAIYLRTNKVTNTINNCLISKNKGDIGSAIFNQKSILTVTKSTISSNNATYKGIIYNNYANTTVNYCILRDNAKIDICNFQGTVNADYNWWANNNRPDSNRANNIKVNNWVYFKLDVGYLKLNQKATTKVSINNVYNGSIFKTINANNLPVIEFKLTINGGGISKSLNSNLTGGVYNITNNYTKTGVVNTTAYVYNIKLTNKTEVDYFLKDKITSLFVQIGASVTTSTVNSWKNAGITDVYVQTSTSNGGTDKLKNVISLCKNTNIRVHAWVICFSNGNSFTVSQSRQTLIKNFVQKLIKINGVDGICLDYVRYSGTNKAIVKSSVITNFVKSVNSIVKGYDKNMILSACVFAEKEGTKIYYGQDYAALSPYIDVMLAMTYKYDYNQGRSWLKSSTSYIVKQAKYSKVVSVLQTYKGTSRLTKLSKSELEADAKAVMSVGSYGYSLFRYGLISSYPKSAMKL